MLALATSLLIAALLVVPDLLQRVIINWFIPLKTIDRARSEQLGRALFSIVVPLLATLLLVHLYLPLHRLAFSQYSDYGKVSPRADMKTIFSSLVSDDRFKAAGNEFYLAVGRLWQSAWPLLLLFYAICIGIACAIGGATYKYGAMREWSERHGFTWLRFLINKVLLEKVSFWHALLTPFTLADKSATITVDVLLGNGILYSGLAYQYFLDGDGKLAGIVLRNPRRFMRDEYLARKKESGSANKDDFWKLIPSNSLLLTGSAIVNLNVTFSTRQPLAEIVQRFMTQQLRYKGHPLKISISEPSKHPTEPPPATE